jgi:hypothetical protein
MKSTGSPGILLKVAGNLQILRYLNHKVVLDMFFMFMKVARIVIL